MYEFYAYLKQQEIDRKVMPSIREMMVYFGTSYSTVRFTLSRLRSAEKIDFQSSYPRSIDVIDYFWDGSFPEEEEVHAHSQRETEPRNRRPALRRSPLFAATGALA